MKKGACKHYTGCQNEKCAAGVAYRDVTSDPDNRTGIAFRSPCIQWDKFYEGKRGGLSRGQLEHFAKRGSCDKYQEPTNQEISDYESAVEAHIARLMKANALIGQVKKEHKGKSWRGVKECPVCKGKLHMSHSSYNGHVHGKCETKDCLAWME